MSPDAFFKHTLPILLWRFLLLLPVVLFAACEGSQQQPAAPASDAASVKNARETRQARDVLEDFIRVSIRRDYAAYYDRLSEKDRDAVSRQDFVAHKQSEGASLADAYFEKISYRIGEVIIDGDRARAAVEYRFPDVEYMIKHVFGLSILSDFTESEIMQMKQELEQAYADRPVPMKSRHRNFELLREDGEWRVYLGWDKTGGPLEKDTEKSS